MHDFRYIGNQLWCERVKLAELAEEFGTPLYVYSQNTLTSHFQRLDEAMVGVDHLICFAVKSNSNRSVLRALAKMGGGFDIVSGGELQRVIEAGGDPRRCAFAGVGKSNQEIQFALRQGVHTFNVESESELERINSIAREMKRVAPVAVRVNPDIQAGTHKKITTGTYANKFGVAYENIEAVYGRARRLKNLRLRGLQMHIGSQITEVTPFEQAVRKVVPLAQRLKDRHGIEFLSIGGGLGIVYQPALASGSSDWWKTSAAKHILTPEKYAARLVPLLQPLGLRVLMEPGRFISGNAGTLITRVEYLKSTGKKHFVIVDAAMNDLIRPAFYDAYHEIVPLRRRSPARVTSDVVGPICESGDFFCQDRPLPRVMPGDYLALLSAGAYGFVMASNYNTRRLAAEVLVHGSRAALVRRRQPLEEVWRGETFAPWLK